MSHTALVFVAAMAGTSPPQGGFTVERCRLAQSKVPYRTVCHVIVPGDGMGRLALRYGIEWGLIVRQNRLPDAFLPPAGRVLLIPALRVPVAESRLRVRVGAGDTARSVAKRLNTSSTRVARENGVTVDQPLEAGGVLHVPIEVEDIREQLFEKPMPETLPDADAVQMTNGPGFRVRNRYRAHARKFTALALKDAFAYVAEVHPNAHHGWIADISKEGGGHLPLASGKGAHTSHQGGYDVDAAYYSRHRDRKVRLRKTRPGDLDVAATWTFLYRLIRLGALRYVFIDHALQRPLYEHAQKVGVSQDELDEIFQYPDGRHAKSGLIRHVDGHATHMHLRFNPR